MCWGDGKAGVSVVDVTACLGVDKVKDLKILRGLVAW